MSAGILLLALLIDHSLGWPEPLYRRIGHPVTWLGKLINQLENRLNPSANEPRACDILGIPSVLKYVFYT